MATSSLDEWTIREKLCLASSVLRSGDQNWVSVSRAIKPFMEPNRPSDWVSQKNCAIQYSAMLEAVETPKRKRTSDKGEADAPVDLLVRRMTQERIEELRHQLAEERRRFKQLQEEIQAIQSGQMDDQLSSIWEAIQQKRKEEEEAAESKAPASAAATAKPKQSLQSPFKRRGAPVKTPKAPQKTQATPGAADGEEPAPDTEPIISVESPEPVVVATSSSDVEPGPQEGDQAHAQAQAQAQPALLSSLLTNEEEDKKDAGKGEGELEEIVTIDEFMHIFTDSTKSTPTKETGSTEKEKPTVTSVTKVKESPALSKLLLPPPPSAESGTSQDGERTAAAAEESIAEEVEMTTVEGEKEEVVKRSDVVETEPKTEREPEKSASDETTPELAAKFESEVKPDVEGRKPEAAGGKLLRVSHEAMDVEPVSPSAQPKVEKKRGRGRPSNASRKSARMKVVKQDEEEDIDTKLPGEESGMSLDDVKDETRSDAADSEDHDRPSESDDASVANLSLPPMFSDSLPNSPSSISHSEEDHAYRLWRKAIMLVWRAAASHKYASVFHHPVTDDIAPGYRGIVHQPMDLVTIKKKIESGSIRTTEAFHRSILLMFQNAIMYNSSDHDVYHMAVSMQNDVIRDIEEFISTQLMVQQPDSSKILRGREATARRSEVTTKEEEGKSRRSSTDHQETSGKKRRTRADEV